MRFLVEFSELAFARNCAGNEIMSDKSLCQYTGKVKYGHKETADSACRAMELKGHHGLESFRCERCRKWHIGHSPLGIKFTFRIERA